MKSDNWQTKKLVDITTLIKGKKPKLFSKSGTKPYLTARVVRGTEIPNFVDNNCPVSVWVKPKDIVIIMDGSNSGEMFSGLNGALSSTMGIIKFDEELIDARYLYSFLLTHRENFTKSRTGAAIPHLNKEGFENLKIPLPSLTEQKRIVKILNGAFEKIAKAKENAEKNLQNSKDLFQAYLQSLFDDPLQKWRYLTLKEISLDFGRGKSKHRPRNDKKLYGGKYAFIQTGDIRNSGHFIDSYSQTYNEVGLAQSKLWPKGSICITIAANIAETGILNFDSCFPDSVIGLVVDPKLADVDFVEYLLQSFKAILKLKGKGSAQDNINMSTFENERFPFTDIKTQKLIVNRLSILSEQTKKLEANYKQKIADLEELKKSLLTKAFAGEL